MADTTKVLSEYDASQTLQGAFNDVDKTLSVNGFLVGKVGHKVEMAIATTNVANDTEVFTFTDSGATLYILTVIYTDGTRETFLSAERTA